MMKYSQGSLIETYLLGEPVPTCSWHASPHLLKAFKNSMTH